MGTRKNFAWLIRNDFEVKPLRKEKENSNLTLFAHERRTGGII
jgi:hypothetical protein